MNPRRRRHQRARRRERRKRTNNPSRSFIVDALRPRLRRLAERLRVREDRSTTEP